ncbi:MAG TPA: PepSY domain-containing protein [Euzebyales bacterium]|nr:PepSY domain-containing protein [Euzebyales bacterium]
MSRKLMFVVGAVLTLALLTTGIAVAAGNRADDAAPADTATQSNDGSQLDDSGTADDAEDADTPDDDQEAGEAQDSDENLTGSPAEQAAKAALAATGGGTVLEVEAGDDPNAAYEVEIRTPNGDAAEVLLDTDFDVIGSVAGDDD